MRAFVILTDDVPLFVMVTLRAAIVPRYTLPKFTLVGEMPRVDPELTVIEALAVFGELLSAVTVTVFGYVPTLELELLACTLVPIAGDRLPNEQFNT